MKVTVKMTFDIDPNVLREKFITDGMTPSQVRAMVQEMFREEGESAVVKHYGPSGILRPRRPRPAPPQDEYGRPFFREAK